MKPKLKTFIRLSITVFPETITEINDLLDAKLYPNRSQLIRSGVKYLHERTQIQALVNDFVQMDSEAQYKQFFNQIKELINDV